VSWLKYWDENNGDEAMYRKPAGDYCQRFVKLVRPAPGASLLDYGSGMGLVADGLAGIINRIELYDPSPAMREKSQTINRNNNNVKTVDSPQRIGSGFDYILINSVIQYLQPDELLDILVMLVDKLAPGGAILITDVIPGKVRRFSEIVELLKFALRNGCLLRTVKHLAGLFFSDYYTIVQVTPLVFYPVSQLETIAARAGCSLDVLPGNLYYNQLRYAAVIRKKPI